MFMISGFVNKFSLFKGEKIAPEDKLCWWDWFYFDYFIFISL